MSDDHDLSRYNIKNALAKIQELVNKSPKNSKQYDYYDTMADTLAALYYATMCWDNYARMYKKTNDRLTIIESALAHLIRDSQENKAENIDKFTVLSSKPD